MYVRVHVRACMARAHLSYERVLCQRSGVFLREVVHHLPRNNQGGGRINGQRSQGRQPLRSSSGASQAKLEHSYGYVPSAL